MSSRTKRARRQRAALVPTLPAMVATVTAPASYRPPRWPRGVQVLRCPTCTVGETVETDDGATTPRCPTCLRPLQRFIDQACVSREPIPPPPASFYRACIAGVLRASEIRERHRREYGFQD